MSLETLSVVMVQCSGPCAQWMTPLGEPGPRFMAAWFANYVGAEIFAHANDWFDGHDGRFAKDQTKARLVPLCPSCRSSIIIL